MTGYVKNGVVILDEPGELPEGARVEVALKAEPKETQPARTNWDSLMAFAGTENSVAAEVPLREGLMKFAGTVTDLPEDASLNVDHYLYGHPKR